MAERSLSYDFKLQVTNLGFDKRFVQVCRLWKYIFNQTDTLLLSLCFLRQCYLYIYKAQYSQFNMLDFKLQVTNLGFDKRFVQVCRLWKYIFNQTDTLLLSLCFLRQCCLYIYVHHL